MKQALPLAVVNLGNVLDILSISKSVLDVEKVEPRPEPHELRQGSNNEKCSY